MRISDLLDVIEDDTVPIQEQDIIASERIMEVTMAKINAAKDANNTAKKKLSKGAIAAMIAAACLALSATAFATGIAERVVGWDGKSVDSGAVAPEPAATEPPDAVMVGEESLDEVFAAILDEAAERELVIVRYGERAASTERTAPVESAEDLEALLKKENSPLVIPLEIPEDCRVISCRVSYESAPGYGYTLESTETRENGVVIERYSAPEEGDFISGFQLALERDDGRQILLRGEMTSDAHSGFGVRADGDVTPLDVEGMADALGIEESDEEDWWSTIFLRRAMDAPVGFEGRFSLMLDEPEGAPRPPFEDAFEEIVYSIRGEGMTVDELRASLIF